MIIVENTLFFEMLERICVAAVAAFLLSQTPLFRRLLTHNKTRITDRCQSILIFSALAIFGSYAGVPIDDAIANSRVIFVMLAGLLGGPVLGSLTGLIAGIHRYSLGGFTALACSVSCILEGLLAGLIYKLYRGRTLPWPVVLTTGLVGEALQMGIILIIAKPFSQALMLVNTISVPMTVSNSIGLTVFMIIIRRAYEHEDRIAAEQSHKALYIANRTLAYLRGGLTEKNAEATVQIILKNTNYQAIAMTDTTKVIAYAGAEASHHAPLANDNLTQITKLTLQSGTCMIAHNSAEIGCTHPDCHLSTAIVVPLFMMNRIVGTLKLYYTHKQRIAPSDVVFAKGVGLLFSTQLELAEIDNQTQLAAKAKLRALHMQINPHFLFNTLNTISSLTRTQPDQARCLLNRLSTLFRFTLQKTGKIISIKDELYQLDAYLSIAQARQGDKLAIKKNIDPTILSCGIPFLCLQPIVENAIQHGLHKKETGGTLTITGTLEPDNTIQFSIEDDGVGMIVTPELFTVREDHIGLYNVQSRLQGQYGTDYGLTITSTPNSGTIVLIRLPLQTLTEVACLA